MTPPAPADPRTRNAPVGPLHRPRKPVLHIATQLRVDSELRRLGTSSATVRMPLRGRGPILRPTGASRGVALQLSADRRRCTTQLPRDLSHPITTSEQHGDLLPLGERQIAPRHRREAEKWYFATLPQPP